jgi:hypothetical protein
MDATDRLNGRQPKSFSFTSSPEAANKILKAVTNGGAEEAPAEERPRFRRPATQGSLSNAFTTIKSTGDNRNEVFPAAVQPRERKGGLFQFRRRSMHDVHVSDI